MTNNRTTELLREGLTEHGIEWRSGLEGVTFVGDWCFVEYDSGKLAATCEPVLTPDQAIAATLGSGTCHITASATDGLCSDNPRQRFELSCGHSFTLDGLGAPVACPICGKAVKR